jgi:hypothetical protein
MSKFLLAINLSSFVALSISLLACSIPVASAELKGAVETQGSEGSSSMHQAKASKSGRVLEGGIKDNATLHPSLKLLPAKQDRMPPPIGGSVQHVTAPLDSEMVRGPGGILYAPGQPVPTVVPSSNTQSGSTSPISTYTLMPQNSRFWVAPGFEIQSTPGISNSASTPSLYDSTPPVSVKGITSYGSSSAQVVTIKREMLDTVPSTGSGIKVFEPLYAVSASLSSLESSHVSTGDYSSKGITSFVPGSHMSQSVPPSGVICWAPGYEVSIQSGDISKETIGGVWSTSTPNIPALRAVANPLQGIRQYVEAVQGPPPMMATALLLPGLKPTVSMTGLNWDQWYHRVAKSIYGRWQTEAVGPGIATVRLTVTKYRELNCQVVGFTSVSGVERNAEAEKAFREAALRSVNDVSMFEIPEFPNKPARQEVTFDIQMKRTVEGGAGFDVSAVAATPGSSVTEVSAVQTGGAQASTTRATATTPAVR